MTVRELGGKSERVGLVLPLFISSSTLSSLVRGVETTVAFESDLGSVRQEALGGQIHRRQTVDSAVLF